MSTQEFPYSVLGELIRGGCSIIYKIRPVNTALADDRKFVLKTMTTAEDDPQSHRRFYMEYEFLRAYPHPNLIQVREYFPDWQGQPAYVMEWLEGNTWQDHWRDRNTMENLKEFFDIFKQLCDVLDFIHKHQIIHRDLKPQNIMISKQNVLKLIDFGIMKVADLTLYTHRNTFMGSAYYVSPEGISGEQVNHTADIFALGVILYDQFTGMKPFKGPTLGETIYQRLVKKPQPPSQIADLPKEFDDIILKMLQRDPRHRYQSCREIYQHVIKAFDSFQPQPKRGDKPSCDVLTKGFFFHTHFLRKCHESLGKKRFLMLVGQAGAGKTTLVENLSSIYFSESPLRIDCYAGCGELDLMESILKRLNIRISGNPEIQPWIDILGNALPGLQWVETMSQQNMGHSTILSAFQRVLFSAKGPTLLVIEELHQASPHLLKFLLHLGQLAQSSSNQNLFVVFTSEVPIEPLSSLGHMLEIEFPDVISLSEYLRLQFGGCRITMELTQSLVELASRNISSFIQFIKHFKEQELLVVRDGVLHLEEAVGGENDSGSVPIDILETAPPEQLTGFSRNQVVQLQWIALCPDGVDLNLLSKLTGLNLTALSQTIDLADSRNLLEVQSGTTDGFRWKSSGVRDYLIEALTRGQKIDRFNTLAQTIEEESRQFLSNSPPLWLTLARLYRQAEQTEKASQYALAHARYCFQNANYEPIRNSLIQFVELPQLKENLEFWCMLAFSNCNDDLPSAIEYAGIAVSIKENEQTLALLAILEYYRSNLSQAHENIEKVFAHGNIAAIDTHFLARLIPIAMAFGDDAKSNTLFHALEKKLKGKNDLFSSDTLTLAAVQLQRPNPRRVIGEVTRLGRQLLPETEWKLKKWLSISYQEVFQYEQALTCLQNQDPDQSFKLSTDVRLFRELLFLHLNFHKFLFVKSHISRYQQMGADHPQFKGLKPLIQLTTEVLINDPKIFDINHVFRLIQESRQDLTRWLTLITNLLDFRQLSPEFLTRVIEVVEAGGIPWARNQLSRLRTIALFASGQHIKVVYQFQKSLRKTDETGLIMEKLRLKILRDHLVAQGLIPDAFAVALPPALLEGPDAVQFITNGMDHR